MIGRAVAWDLARDPDVTSIGLIAPRPEELESTRRWLASPRVNCHTVTAEDRQPMIATLKHYDVAVVALPDRRSDYLCIESVLAAGLNCVDVLEDYHRNPEPSETEQLQLPAGMPLEEYGESLHGRALEHGVTLLDGMGFSPGIANITLGDAIRQLDKAETAVARVGGIPSKSAAVRHPLGYMITWDFAHVLREYMVRLRVIKNGEVIEVSAGSDVESVRFQALGQDEVLEGANTAGMPSFLHTRPGLKYFAEKTLRWPGHWEAVQTLKDCGLLDLEPIGYRGESIVPREFLNAILTPRLRPRPGESDICVMFNTVIGKHHGLTLQIEHFMWDEADPVAGLTAMQRTTGFSAAIAARMLARGQITTKGIVPPEDAICGNLYREFLAALAERHVLVREARTELTPK